MKPHFLILFSAFLSFHVTAGEPEKHSVRPKGGLVPDAETAIQIAKAVWFPIYGRDNIEKQKPFTAHLRDGVWTVTGTLHAQVGGVALADIAQTDGKVIRVTHGR